MSSFKPLSKTVKDITSKKFNKRFVMLGRLSNLWTEIVGDKIARHSVPSKIFYNRYKKTAILQISITSSYAGKLIYQTGIILEKINSLLGPNIITDIKLVHVPINCNKRPVKSKYIKKPLHEDQKEELHNIISEINDAQLKEKLEKFGTSFYEDMNRK